MIDKPIHQIEADDVQRLIENQITERKTIEYKLKLPGNVDSDKKEFLADVSSFANTNGGDLIFGVEERNGAPLEMSGIAHVNLDAEKRRLENMIRDGIEPRVRYDLKDVTDAGSRIALLIRVQQSWNRPHRVVFQGHDKFYGRNSTGKYPLDVGELRAAFAASETLNQRIRAFRADRMIALANNDTPVPFVEGPKIVLHCIPLESFADRRQVDFMQFHQGQHALPTLMRSVADWRINFEGIVSFSRENSVMGSYTQLYRDGVLEAVDRACSRGSIGGKTIAGVAYEKKILGFLPQCFDILKLLDLSPPVIVALSLTGVKGFTMGLEYSPGSDPIEADTLMLPEEIVESYSRSPASILKPLFDMIWNACGLPSSQNFDAGGNWSPR